MNEQLMSEIFAAMTKYWQQRGCSVELAQENAAIQLMWAWQAAQYVASMSCKL